MNTPTPLVVGFELDGTVYRALSSDGDNLEEPPTGNPRNFVTRRLNWFQKSSGREVRLAVIGTNTTSRMLLEPFSPPCPCRIESIEYVRAACILDLPSPAFRSSQPYNARHGFVWLGDTVYGSVVDGDAHITLLNLANSIWQPRTADEIRVWQHLAEARAGQAYVQLGEVLGGQAGFLTCAKALGITADFKPPFRLSGLEALKYLQPNLREPAKAIQNVMCGIVGGLLNRLFAEHRLAGAWIAGPMQTIYRPIRADKRNIFYQALSAGVNERERPQREASVGLLLSQATAAEGALKLAERWVQ